MGMARAYYRQPLRTHRRTAHRTRWHHSHWHQHRIRRPRTSHDASPPNQGLPHHSVYRQPPDSFLKCPEPCFSACGRGPHEIQGPTLSLTLSLNSWNAVHRCTPALPSVRLSGRVGGLLGPGLARRGSSDAPHTCPRQTQNALPQFWAPHVPGNSCTRPPPRGTSRLTL